MTKRAQQTLREKPDSVPCTPEAVQDRCGKLGFDPGQEAIDGLAAYLGLLCKWNAVMNLVGPSAWEQIFDELVVDSFHLANFIRSLPLPEAPESLDLGAGAGLPGIPLRLLWQGGRYTLVEAREKRALFLRAALAAIPLSGVSVFHGRAEDRLARHPPAQLVVSRAFMPWKNVLSLIHAATPSKGLCLFLTLDPLPDALPPGWRALAETGYAAGRDARRLWALQKE